MFRNPILCSCAGIRNGVEAIDFREFILENEGATCLLSVRIGKAGFAFVLAHIINFNIALRYAGEATGCNLPQGAINAM